MRIRLLEMSETWIRYTFLQLPNLLRADWAVLHINIPQELGYIGIDFVVETFFHKAF